MICFNRQQQPEILLVQQNPVEAGATLHEFSKWNEKHRVTSLPDVETAEDFLAQRGIYRSAPRPDMVIIDNDLPGGGAQTLVRMLRTSESLQGVPIVLMGGRDEHERRSTADARRIDKPLELGPILRLARSCGLPWHDRQPHAGVAQGQNRLATGLAFAGAQAS